MRHPILAFFTTSILLGSVVAPPAEPAVNGSELTKTTCDDLAQESQENRAFALIFYYGYLAGRSNASTIDNARVAEQLLQVRDYCTANPDATVIDAFVEALR